MYGVTPVRCPVSFPIGHRTLRSRLEADNSEKDSGKVHIGCFQPDYPFIDFVDIKKYYKYGLPFNMLRYGSSLNKGNGCGKKVKA